MSNAGQRARNAMGPPSVDRVAADGVDLATLIRRRGALPIRDAVRFILQAADILAEAHARGVLHRALTPRAMVVTEQSEGRPPLLQIVDFAPPPISNDDATVVAVRGSPYASPELVRGGAELDARADVWSLGAILYEMLCGRPPSQPASRESLTPLSALNPDVSAGLEAAVEAALSTERSARPDVRMFAASLMRFAPVDAHGLLERIETAPQRVRDASVEEILEISQVEEISVVDDDSSGDAEMEPTRVAKAGTFPLSLDRLPAPPRADAPSRRAPTKQEQTEALGVHFVPSDPRWAAAAAEIMGSSEGPRFAGAAATSSQEATSMLPFKPPSVAQAHTPSHAPRESPGLPAFLPPASLVTQARERSLPPTAAEARPSLSPSMPPQSSPGAPSYSFDRTEPAAESFGRKIAMYAIGGALAAIIILAVALAFLLLGGR